MLTREAVAATLALAGIRTGANVLDLAPTAGLTKAARAMAGAGGRVDAADDAVTDPAAQRPPYGYAIGVWTDRPARAVVEAVTSSRPSLADYARVTLGSGDPLGTLVDELRSVGWTVLHGTTVPDADPSAGGAELSLAVARVPL